MILDRHIQFKFLVLLSLAMLWLGKAYCQPSGSANPNQNAPNTQGGNNTQKAPGQGTTNVSTPKFPVITLNLDLTTFSDYLPFDVDFMVAGGSSTDLIKLSDIKSIDLYYIDKGNQPIPLDNDPMTNWKCVEWVNQLTSSQYTFRIAALEPNKKFTFVFKYQRVVSQEEKTKLVPQIQAILLPVILDVAQAGHHEFNDDQVTQAAADIKDQILLALKKDNINVKIDIIDAAKQKKLFQSARNIIESYHKAYFYLADLDLTIGKLQRTKDSLIDFSVKYRNTSLDPDKEANLNAIDAIINALLPLYNRPINADALDAAKVKTYTDSYTALLGAFNKIKLPQNIDFHHIETIIDNQSESVMDKFAIYCKYLKDQQSITTDQLTAFVNLVATTYSSYVTINSGNVNGDFVTRSNTYVAGDAGIAVLPKINRLTPYLGTNIYFRPVNPDAPLNTEDDYFPGERKPGAGDFLGKRLSLVIGVSVSSLARPYVRTDLFGSSFNVITGAGFRITDWIHVSGGYTWYSSLDANPLNTNTHITATPYISISFDLRIKTALNSLFAGSAITSVSP